MFLQHIGTVPLLDDDVSEDALTSRPAIHQVGPIGIVRNNHVIVASGLHAEYVNLTVDPSTIIQDHLVDVDVAGPLLKAVAELTVLISLLTGTIQSTGSCLLVTVDEDVVENILFLSDLVQELPDASLSGVTNVAALRIADLSGLLQYTTTLGNRINLELVAKGHHVSLVTAHSGQHAGEVVNLRDKGASVLTGKCTPSGAAVIGKAHGPALELRHVINGDIHALLQGVQGNLRVLQPIAVLHNCLIGTIVPERELLAGTHTVFQLLHVGLNFLKVGSFVPLFQNVPDVTEHCHVPHIDGLYDLAPGLTLGTEVLPGLVVVLYLNRAGSHQLPDDIAGSMANTNSVNHSNISFLVLCHLVCPQLVEVVRPGTLQQARHLRLTPIDIDEVRHLSHGVVSTGHYLGVDLPELTRILTGKLLALGVHSRTHHDDLGVQPDMVLVTQGNSPVQCTCEVIV